jgi:uncharacterized protein YaiI (UPF0178 family)
MSNDSIIAQIEAEIAKLTQVRSLLSNTGKVVDKIAAIKTKLKERNTKATATVAKAKGKKRRTLSPEARKRIADAQRKRWAALKGKKA